MNKLKSIIYGGPVVIAIVYMLIGGLWIAFSDAIVLSLFSEAGTITQIQTLKGWIFVAVTGLFIYSMVLKNNTMIGQLSETMMRVQKKFDATFEQSAVGIVHHSPEKKIIRANSQFCELLGYHQDELAGLNIDRIIHPDDLLGSAYWYRELRAGELPTYSVEQRFRHRDGHYINCLLTRSIVHSQNGEAEFHIDILQDITRLKEFEAALQKALARKEMYLAEIHHRVNNNLAIINSLFQLQMMHTDDRNVISVLEESSRRLKCMSMIHEQFSGGERTIMLKFDMFLTNFLSYFSGQYRKDGGSLELTSNLRPLQVNINQAIPLGLLVNELMMQIGKKMGAKDSGELHFQLSGSRGNVELTIRNPDRKLIRHVNTTETSGLGVSLITVLLSQLRGEMLTGDDHLSIRFRQAEVSGGANSLKVSDIAAAG